MAAHRFSETLAARFPRALREDARTQLTRSGGAGRLGLGCAGKTRALQGGGARSSLQASQALLGQSKQLREHRESGTDARQQVQREGGQSENMLGKNRLPLPIRKNRQEVPRETRKFLVELEADAG